jgi:hypothetical protein
MGFCSQRSADLAIRNPNPGCAAAQGAYAVPRSCRSASVVGVPSCSLVMAPRKPEIARGNPSVACRIVGKRSQPPTRSERYTAHAMAESDRSGMKALGIHAKSKASPSRRFSAACSLSSKRFSKPAARTFSRALRSAGAHGSTPTMCREGQSLAISMDIAATPTPTSRNRASGVSSRAARPPS